MPVSKSPIVPNENDIPATAKIVLIDDDPFAAKLMRALARELRPGWRLLDAQEGKSGLSLAKTERPDVVLLDSLLPSMNGDAVLAALRADPATANVPVLMLSADARPASRERLLKLGANDHMVKPFDIAEVVARIETLLATHRQ